MPADILVVEDNPTNLELMCYLLTAVGHAPRGVLNGKDAIAAAQKRKPDLVICDIQLPGFDGYQVASVFKADDLLKTIPLIAVTALAMVGERERILRAGFDGYFSKPIEPETFLADLNKFLAVKHHSPAPEQDSVFLTVATAHRPIRQQKGTILVLDDSEPNRDLFQSLLEPHGYRLILCATNSEAMTAARKEQPTLAIADLHLRKESGMDFLKAMRAEPELASIPVIITSATQDGTIEVQPMKEAGVAVYVSRPIDPAELLRIIESVIRGR